MVSKEAKRYLESLDQPFLRRLAAHYLDIELECIESVIYGGYTRGDYSVLAHFSVITKNKIIMSFKASFNTQTGTISKRLGYSGDFS